MANIVYKSGIVPGTNGATVYKDAPLLNTEIDGNFKGIQDELASIQSLKAPLESPTLTGTPTAPTATAGTNSTQLATTAYTDAAVEAFRTATATLTNKTLTSPTINTPTIGTSATVPLIQGSTSASANLQLTSTSSATKGAIILGSGSDTVRINSTLNGFVKASGSNGALSVDTNTYYNTGGTDVAVADGGTGVSTIPTNGQLLIGNGTGYTVATLTDGTGISVTEGVGSITVTNTGVTSLTGTTNRITVSASTGSVTLNLPQDIHTTATPSFSQVALGGDPASALQAATKQYVDNAILGLDVKASVKFATTATVTLAGGAPNTIDGGNALTLGDRILVKNQGTPAQNGIYTVTTVGTGANGTWTRATDMDNWNEVPGSFVFVEQGAANADTGWVCTANAGGTLGTTDITWTQFAGSGSVTSGTGIAVSGNQVSLATGNVLSLHNLAANGIVARTAANTVTNLTLTGTTNRLSVSNGDGVSGNPTFDISTAYVGQTSITTLGTIATGTWQGSVLAGQYGGTGVANTGKTITLGGNLTLSGAFTTTFTVSNNTSVVLPTSGTLVARDSTDALTNKTVNGLTITSSTGTLTIAAAKTLTANNTLTFTGTDASSVAFGTGGTVVYTANKLSVHAATTSAELAGVISDETGSGSLVFATSPALAGTPTAPTAAATIDNTQIATTAFANRAAQDQAMAMAIALG